MKKYKLPDVMLNGKDIWLSESDDAPADEPDTVIFGTDIFKLSDNTGVELCQWIRDGYEYTFLDVTVTGGFPKGYSSKHEYLASHGLTVDLDIWKCTENGSEGTGSARMQYYRPFDASFFFSALGRDVIGKNGNMLSKEERRKKQEQKSGFLQYCRSETEIIAKSRQEHSL